MDNPPFKIFTRIGTLGIVLQLLKMPDGSVKSLVEGKSRAKIKNHLPDAGFSW